MAGIWETYGGRSDKVVGSEWPQRTLKVTLRSFSFYSVAGVIEDLGAVNLLDQICVSGK